MRLLHTSTLKLKDFAPDRIPPYAILSHTWGEDEVLYADITNGTAEQRSAFQKIYRCCEKAFDQKLHYVWIDTCCINKDSSAELSEAINSMYSWYRNAVMCLAYLDDVEEEEIPNANSSFARSRWFTRGWTLQELIAPSTVKFCSRTWKEIGTKKSLDETLSSITGIARDILTQTSGLQTASVAKRMCWASSRATTRPEDIAYCLMGIFDVNMPLLYGEGDKAFMRLQEEIIKQSDDRSLFAWKRKVGGLGYMSHSGLFAQSPAEFTDSSNVIPFQDWGPDAPFALTNKGLRIELHMRYHPDTDLYSAAIGCSSPFGHLGIWLKLLSYRSKQYIRVYINDLFPIDVLGSAETVYVLTSVPTVTSEAIYQLHVLQIAKLQMPLGYRVITARAYYDSTNLPERHPTTTVPAEYTPPAPFTFRIPQQDHKVACALLVKAASGRNFAILLGSTSRFNLGFGVIDPYQKSLWDLQRYYTPKDMGSVYMHGLYRIQVDAKSVVHNDIKYYLISIRVATSQDPCDIDGGKGKHGSTLQPLPGEDGDKANTYRKWLKLPWRSSQQE